MSKKHDEELAQAYERVVGRPPITRFPEDPDWRYRGSRSEHRELLERLGIKSEDDDTPIVIEDQQELL